MIVAIGGITRLLKTLHPTDENLYILLVLHNVYNLSHGRHTIFHISVHFDTHAWRTITVLQTLH